MQCSSGLCHEGCGRGRDIKGVQKMVVAIEHTGGGNVGNPHAAGEGGICIDVHKHRLIAGRDECCGFLIGPQTAIEMLAGFTPAGGKDQEHRPLTCFAG